MDLEMIEHDRDGWLDGVRDIQKHDFEIWEYEIKLTMYHHSDIIHVLLSKYPR